MNALALYGLSAAMLATITGAHEDTARRWKRASRVPKWLLRLVALVAHGELGEIDEHWRGWRVVRGQIVSPEGWTATPGDIRALPLMRQQIAVYQADRRLPAQADWVSGSIDTLPGALNRDAAPRPRADVVPLRATSSSR